MNLKPLLIGAMIAGLPAAVMAQDATGAYFGIAAGGSDIDVNSGALDGDGPSVGIYAGYNFAANGVIYGGEFDFDSNQYEVPAAGATVDYATRLKARVGVPVGPGVAYGVGGFILATSDQLDDGRGYLYGVAYDMPFGDSYHVGAEILQHEFDDDVLEVGVTTFKVRVGFNF
ncbi:outer membrane beta-barrel protein [Loktanella sp. 3ANDIMAR09]|uniref:outer membrane beta-barrel protein n=1 Tax=Loktanella sp. 3ANDIMAR09 TaxID=1225657 RepID=UPI0006F2E566|nr:outer membrane beta-barrel protein [Loktanella sp. 3ANDIMAR09]